MERGLYERDIVGLQDFILLEDCNSEEAFIDNLRKRFQANLIYTYIGQVLVSVNPYKELNIYTEQNISEYRGKHFFEAPPHIFAIAENAYRRLTEENRGQCILISGESGSGKTEASKKVLQYIAAASGHEATVEGVKDKLLQTNPMLEAFGNAKTNRNDNSSRFGKYMDVQFNYAGQPDGGNILNYLLEKSRVVHQTPGERNFHVFYQLLAGADDQQLLELRLRRNPDAFYYLSDGAQGASAVSLDDAADFAAIQRAMQVIGIGSAEQREIFQIVAAVLHLGNVGFGESDAGQAVILKPEAVSAVAMLLGADEEQLRDALTQRTIEARGDRVRSPLNREMAIYARDALAKAVYDRLFTWLVARINESLKPPGGQTPSPQPPLPSPTGSVAAAAADAWRQPLRGNNVMGILDIYGFEIFAKNSFEQFCINFCNEKLQQLFVELTLNAEQAEYQREGIEWEPVAYFDNQIICSLIEEKHRGIIAIMDEECLRPGDRTDRTFLAKMNERLGGHAHYVCHAAASVAVQKTLGRDDFRLRHYAGDVTYEVAGFLDKNNDLLFRDLKEVMAGTANTVSRRCFPPEEYLSQRRRPNTAVTQFRHSLNQLMDILMCKEPSYIRCIKPNDAKRAGEFGEQLVLHQVKYLGLMENLRVRRAGFAYRRTYEMFLRRYKCLSQETWPHYDGPAEAGVRVLVRALGYADDEYRMGRTKLFIRSPRTLFDTEDAFQARKHWLASLIQARWKGRRERLAYQHQRACTVLVQSLVRRWLARRRAAERREAVDKVRAFIRGFITRNAAPNGYNEAFIAHAKRQWLLRLAASLPQTVLEQRWIGSPQHCADASAELRRVHRRHLVRVYRRQLSEEKKRQFELKVLAESLFKDKKKNYADSVGPWFVDDRVPKEHQTAVQNFVGTQLAAAGERLHYATPVVKYDRHGYKPRERLFLLSSAALYLLDGRTYKQKHRLPLDKIDFCVLSERDSLMLVRIPVELKRDKGDLILEMPEVIECCVWLVDVTGRRQAVNIVQTGSLSHSLPRGKSGVIEIQTGAAPSIGKTKTGHLLVIAGQ